MREQQPNNILKVIWGWGLICVGSFSLGFWLRSTDLPGGIGAVCSLLLIAVGVYLRVSQCP